MGSLGRGPTVTIASGQTVSNGVDIHDAVVVGIITPAALTGVALTFQGSHDNVTYKAVTKVDGTAYTVTVAASKYVVIPSNDLGGMRFLKVVSGTAELADRDIILVLRNYA